MKKRKQTCSKCEKKFTVGEFTESRWFYDNNTDYYDCGTTCFTSADLYIVNRYTCGDCNTNK